MNITSTLAAEIVDTYTMPETAGTWRKPLAVPTCLVVTGCDTCDNGCGCQIGEPGCGHFACWGTNANPRLANSCPSAIQHLNAMHEFTARRSHA